MRPGISLVAAGATVLGSLRKVAMAAAVAAAGLSLSGCDGSQGMMGAHHAIPATFRSNGERIYFTGTSGSGAPIAYAGGNVHLQMMGGGCATCHGTDRNGGRMMPEFWIVAPPLTREALFAHDGDGDGHHEHASYDEKTLRRAIASGVDPSGARLDATMPRWSMSPRDWNDLLAYLRE